MQESLDITLTVGDDNFKAPKDLELPFEVLSGSTAELGKHFLVKDDATSFIVPKDGNTATLTLLPGPDVDLNNPATLKLGVDEQGGRFIAGEIPSVTVTVKGLLSYAALAGTWECKELIGLEMLELWAMEMRRWIRKQFRATTTALRFRSPTKETMLHSPLRLRAI